MRSPAGICTVSVVEFTNVAFSDKPFHSATLLEAKPVPETVIVTDGLPATAEDGLSAVIAGPAAAGVIVNVLAFDWPPEGLPTVICAVPAVPRRITGTCAVRVVGFT